MLKYFKERGPIQKRLIPFILPLLAILFYRLDLTRLNPVLWVVLIVMVAILVFISYRLYIDQDRKVSITEDGKITVPFARRPRFIPNTYSRMHDNIGAWYLMQFTVENIKKISILYDPIITDKSYWQDQNNHESKGTLKANYRSNARRTGPIEMRNIKYDSKKAVCVEFIHPLKHVFRDNMERDIGKEPFPDLKRFCFSIDHPEQFKHEITNMQTPK